MTPPIGQVRTAYDDARRRAEEEARWHEECLGPLIALNDP